MGVAVTATHQYRHFNICARIGPSVVDILL